MGYLWAHVSVSLSNTLCIYYGAIDVKIFVVNSTIELTRLVGDIDERLRSGCLDGMMFISQ